MCLISSWVGIDEWQESSGVIGTMAAVVDTYAMLLLKVGGVDMPS